MKGNVQLKYISNFILNKDIFLFKIAYIMLCTLKKKDQQECWSFSLNRPTKKYLN